MEPVRSDEQRGIDAAPRQLLAFAIPVEVPPDALGEGRRRHPAELGLGALARDLLAREVAGSRLGADDLGAADRVADGLRDLEDRHALAPVEVVGTIARHRLEAEHNPAREVLDVNELAELAA